MQKTFFKTRIIIGLFCTFLLVTLLTYCKKELPNPPVNGNPPDTALRTDCKLYMSYEVETTRLIRPLNEADFQILSTVDKAITLPQRDRYSVEVCYKSNGQKSLIMTRLAPDNPISYPEGAITGYQPPNYSKVVYANGSVTYYDQYNAVMSTEPYNSTPAAIQQILDMVESNNPMTDAAFNARLQVLKDRAGLLLQEHDNNLCSIRTNYDDGSYSVQVIDKTTRVSIGNMHYSTNGDLLARSMYDVSGTSTQPVINRYLHESYFTSVTGQIPMKIQEHGIVSNFILSIN